MISMSLIQQTVLRKDADDCPKFVEIFTLFFEAFYILFELGCLKNRFHYSQLFIRSSTFSKWSKFRPVRESFMAISVVSFGISTEKGSPFLSVI